MPARSAPVYHLYYWPTIQGRGEFVRLALEDAAAAYVDVARQPDGMKAMSRVLDAPRFPAFAPPALRAGDLVIFQTANILQWLAPRLKLVPAAEVTRVRANQLQLTVADLVAEVHNTHHPIAARLYFEDQKREARENARYFASERIPKFLTYFERVVDRRGFAFGKHTYVDLSLFQVLEGLTYAFPRAMKRIQKKIPHLHSLAARVRERPRVRSYLASGRRLAFNEDGIFRHYPELDR